jgi:hypothetical protein
MRRFILVLAATALLSGCATSLQSMYDEQAREECDNNASTTARGSCYDRVDQNSRERRRGGE